MSYTGVGHDALIDLLATTQNKEKWNGQFEYLRSRHGYPMLNRLFRGSMTNMIEGGKAVKWNIQHRESGNAQFTQPAAVRERTILDTQIVAELAWSYAFGSYTIIKDEMLENFGDVQIVNLVKSRRLDGLVDLANKIEPRLWLAPTGAADVMHPKGVFYHLPPITTAQVSAGTGEGDHQGTYTLSGVTGGTSYTDWCGISGITASVYPRLRSYNAAWTNDAAQISEEDLRRLGRMHRRLHWENPLTVGEMEKVNAPNLFIGAPEAIIDAYSLATRRLNDDIAKGNDAAAGYGAGFGKGGEPVFKGVGLTWVEDLTGSTTGVVNGYQYPLFMLNLDYWKPAVFRDCNFVENKPMNHRDQPDVYVTDIDVKFQMRVTNRQLCGGVISYPQA